MAHVPLDGQGVMSAENWYPDEGAPAAAALTPLDLTALPVRPFFHTSSAAHHGQVIWSFLFIPCSRSCSVTTQHTAVLAV